MKYLHRLTPRVSKRNLLLVAAAVWLFAGLMLFVRGVNMYFSNGGTYDKRIFISVFFGIIFFFGVFLEISNKHIRRILTLENESAPFYYFFNKRSYLMMILMITLGITLRKTEIVSADYLGSFYITMGIPLITSGLRFLYVRFSKSSAFLNK